MNRIVIGNKIKTLRWSKMITLKQLAELSGVQIATLSRIEHNKMTGTVTSHARIANALGVRLVDLYSDLSPKPPVESKLFGIL